LEDKTGKSVLSTDNFLPPAEALPTKALKKIDGKK